MRHIICTHPFLYFIQKGSYLLNILLMSIVLASPTALAQCQPAKTGNPCASTSRAPTLNLGAGNPIHLISGNKFQHEHDLLMRLSGLEFSRYYNSLATIASPMGAGWSHSYHVRLFKLPHSWQVLLDDGQRIMFPTKTSSTQATSTHTSQRPIEFQRFLAQIPQQGYLQQNSLQEWEWHTPEGTIRTFNSQGYLQQISMVGFPTIHIDYQTIQQHTLISKVYNQKEQIIFHYDAKTSSPLLTHIDTPVGSFHYHYDTPTGFSHARLLKVTRADGWQRQYLYEKEHQAGDPYRLTGIVLTTPQQQSLRLNEWHYQEDGKAIYSRSTLTLLHDTKLFNSLPNAQLSKSLSNSPITNSLSLILQQLSIPSHELYIEYAQQAHHENDESLTIVRDHNGRETRITGVIKGGHYLLKSVSGNGCYLCPPTGTRATYNAKGQLQSINGFTLLRDENGNIYSIEFQHPTWGKVTLQYDAQGFAKQWHTAITGYRMAGPPSFIKVALNAPQTEVDLAHFDHDNLVFKNGLVLKQINANSSYRSLMLEKDHQPIWVQAREYNAQGLLEKEHLHYLPLHQLVTTHYRYDQQHRLISALQQIHNHSTPDSLSAPSTPSQETLFYYAWNKDGSNQAYAINERTYFPKVLRNIKGLPTHIDDKQLFYEEHNRIQTVKKDQQIIAQYQYDRYGRRIQKTTPNSHTSFSYQGNQLSTETVSLKPNAQSSTASNFIRQRQYFYRGVMPIGFVEKHLDHQNKILSVQTFFIHNDHLGLPVMVTDEQQNIRWAAYYTPTGKAIKINGDIEFNLRQPGQYFDEETEWHDNYLRTYDPEAGHYLEPDPLGPLAWNDPYGYVAQQPRHFIDPVGLLLFAFDGTTNNKDSDTNVWKFYQLYRGPKFYKEGPGAIPNESTHDRNGGSLFGTTINRILDEQKKNLIQYMRSVNNNFAETTPIDIVGFSRGAIMGMIFSNYVKTLVKDGLFHYQETFVEDGIEKIHHIQSCVDLRFIGLFDAVAQIGLNGVYNRRFDYTAAPEWAVIAHAIALNEYRSVLPLTVYQGADNVIEQGFIGNHSDLGGVHVPNDPKDQALHATQRGYGDLGDIPLAWIYTQAQQIGVDLNELGSIRSRTGGRLDEITYPVIHNTYGEYLPAPSPDVSKYASNIFTAIKGKRTLDRDIQLPSTSEHLHRQGESQHIGDHTRQTHIQAANVQFMWKYWLAPSIASVGIYGKLNAQKYLAWLEKELNWKSPIKTVNSVFPMP